MNNLNVLIIDDDPKDIILLTETIHSSFPGIRIFEATSGKTGLRRIRENEIDLILLDVQMPEMNGFETARQIKTTKGAAHIPIIFMTGTDPDKKWAGKVTDAGAMDYLTKPTGDVSHFVHFLYLCFRFMKREREIHEKLCEANRQLKKEINERIQLEEKLTQRQNRLTLLNRISTRITSAMSVEQVIKHTVRQISRYFSDYRIAYSTVDPQGKLTVVYSREPEWMPKLTGFSTDITVAPAYLNHLLGQNPVVVNDVLQDPRMAPLASVMEAGHTRAMLDLPLAHSDQLIGLACFDSSAPREWTDHEIATLTEVIRYLSVIIKEARIREERRQAEEALRFSETRFRNLFEFAPDAMFLADPETGKILDANRAASELMRMPRHEIIGRHQSELHPPQQEDFAKRTFREHIQEAETQGITSPVEIPVFRADGVIRHVEVLAQMIDLQNKPALMGIFRDIETRKQAEEALTQAKEGAEASNRAKSEFLATMSHEIRTPLNAILGFTDILYPLVDDEEQRCYLDAIRSGGRNLSSLINDILDISKIEAGKMEIHYKPADPHIIFDEIQGMFSAALSGKGIDFITNISQDIPHALLLDRARLRQILFNLVGNAVKFTKKGHVKLSAKIRTRDDRDTSDLVISVEDTGIGIPSKLQEEIFEAFGQQDTRTTRKYSGTGLGLVITKRLAEMMNGVVSVKSEVGKGSLFEIVFHDVLSAEAGASGHGSERPGKEKVVLEKATILAADDAKVNLSLLEAHLKDTDFQLIEARHGEEAVSLAARHKPDIILMDLRMPGMDGYEATRQIKADETLRHIPVIALTAVLTDEVKKKVTEAGFNGYMEKPPQPLGLFETISHFIIPSEKERTAGTSPTPKEQTRMIIPPKTFEILPEITKQLEGEFTESWRTACQSETFDEIEDFGRQMAAYGKTHSLSMIEQFGRDLMNYASYFDIDKMKSTLDAYPELIERLKGCQSPDQGAKW